MSVSSHVAAALEFVCQHGIVLASARDNVPRLVDLIAGEPISGNWWSHPKSRFIYNILAQVIESQDVLVCRLLHGKVTFVHRRLWPALVRAAERFEPARIAQVREEHTPGGRHVTKTVAFPLWVPSGVHEQAALLSEEESLVALGPAVAVCGRSDSPPHR